ncbi:transcription factor TFIIF complex subunit Tfg3 [Schizosaccharomyces japonicus yFS275]|uniref:Transcription factor TFIIF complex subunit Tfg3 n=1 Tax=Schizosaccharomyces japonicus (strain yFS275 / FY16936) TaxID=402676 RepID=B6JWF9_SCHJY|nr:transcription factor TFIIF complex subunit Tfg3 [Schizosaccharomyces japonicus yFS275]EEB05710.1 transcription factor TFIIF complex subunit Tfg3 [Schizosaccharomyces japonicus yFS275]
MASVKRTLRIITNQHIVSGEAVALQDQSYAMREWSIRLMTLNEHDEEVDAVFLDRVTYKLHPTFINPNRTVKKPPFQIDERGWGEFEMQIVLHFVDKGGEQTVAHYLSFEKENYHADHELTIPTHKPGLCRALAASGPVPGYPEEPEETRKEKRKNEVETTGRKKVKSKPVDMDKLAEGLQKLQENDLLQVVQLINENKTPEMFVHNDVEAGEFHIDLYTLPDKLLLLLFSFCAKRVSM